MFFFAYIISLVTSSFICDAFENIPYTENLNIDAESISRCKNSKFIGFMGGTINFLPGAFDGFNNLKMLTIEASKEVTFHKSSLCNLPKLNLLGVGGEDASVHFLDQSATNNTALNRLTLGGNKLTIGYESFKDCSNLKIVELELLSYDFASSAFCNCGLRKKNFLIKDSQETNGTVNKCYLGCCDRNGNGGSIGKDNNQNMHIPGNINIESAYITIFKRKFRNTSSRTGPLPEIVHSAIWVGPKDADDNSVGEVFIYNAKGQKMTLAKFKRVFSALKIMKINVHKNLKFDNFVKEINESRNWNAKDWPTNKYHYYTSKIIDILQATYDTPNSNDWDGIPDVILNALKTNEAKK